jgi:hypothetical protein
VDLDFLLATDSDSDFRHSDFNSLLVNNSSSNNLLASSNNSHLANNSNPLDSSPNSLLANHSNPLANHNNPSGNLSNPLVYPSNNNLLANPSNLLANLNNLSVNLSNLLDSSSNLDSLSVSNNNLSLLRAPLAHLLLRPDSLKREAFCRQSCRPEDSPPEVMPDVGSAPLSSISTSTPGPTVSTLTAWGRAIFRESKISSVDRYET